MIDVLVGSALCMAALAWLLLGPEWAIRRAARKQAAWEAHVDEAVRLSATPVYERVAQEFARNLDEEWRQASTTGWAAQ